MLAFCHPFLVILSIILFFLSQPVQKWLRTFSIHYTFPLFNIASGFLGNVLALILMICFKTKQSWLLIFLLSHTPKKHHPWTCFFYHNRCYESGCHSLQLHITHGLHLPSYTALTHSHPPSHQSHSCHQSLICPDCLTTPAPHSPTHL